MAATDKPQAAPCRMIRGHSWLTASRLPITSTHTELIHSGSEYTITKSTRYHAV
jgi:hypothetical protein